MIPLKIKNLKKQYDKKIILNNINLELKKNEIFGLIGLNGVGKTTLIKSIINLIQPDEGEIKILNVDSNDVSSRRYLKYLPEKFSANPILKGMEFLKIFNDFGDSKKQNNLEKEIYNLCDLLALDKESLKHRISKFSKGMMQKLGLISTFLGDSKLIILDEPMSGLDPKARYFLKNLLLKYKKNKSIFFSSHILSDIDEICDRVAILNKGELVFVGTPSALKKKHKEKSLENAFLQEISIIKD